MPSVLSVVVTNAGIAEVINAQHTGTAPVVLAQVGFGRGIYTPTADQTALRDEIKRVSTIAGGVVGSNIMHIQALDSGEAAYAVYEIGVYTASGTLFAVYSQPIPILHKVANSSIMCVIDFVLSGVEPTAVTVGDTDYTLAPATTTNLGVVELATGDEVAAGTDAERAVTPASGAAAYVALRGNQTINGIKTFNSPIVSDSGSMSAVEKTSGDFSTYLGGYSVNRYEIGGITYDYYTSEYCITDGKDYHSLIADSESSQVGVNRRFGLVSKYYDGSNDYKLAKVQNYIVGDLNQNTVEGAVSLEASSQGGNTKSVLTMRKDSVAVSTTNTNLDASNIYIDCHDSFYLRNYASQSNNIALKLSSEISGSYSIYTLETTKSANNTVFNFGRLTNKIDHIYADTFHGHLDGEANSAMMDSMGNELYDSYRGVALASGTTELTFSSSAADPAVIIVLNNAIAAAIQGLRASGDSTYSRPGAVGLFAFGQTSQTEYIPGDTVPGSALYAACMLYDNATQSFSISEGTTSQSGTWRLLSRAVGASGKRCLVLAVKVSESNPA